MGAGVAVGRACGQAWKGVVNRYRQVGCNAIVPGWDGSDRRPVDRCELDLGAGAGVCCSTFTSRSRLALVGFAAAYKEIMGGGQQRSSRIQVLKRHGH